jgi:hypothetical protein
MMKVRNMNVKKDVEETLGKDNVPSALSWKMETVFW